MVIFSEDGTPLATGDLSFTAIPRVDWNWATLRCSADGQTALAFATYGSGVISLGPTVLKTTNAGTSWFALTNCPQAYWMDATLSGDGTKIVASASSGFLYTSPDAGLTWIQQSNAPASVGLFSSGDGHTILAIAQYSQGFYISSDYGVTWALQTNSPGAGFWAAFAPSSDGSRVVGIWNSSYGYNSVQTVYVSTNSGSTWTESFSPAQSCPVMGVACSSNGARFAAGERCGPIMTSSDGGTTWTRQLNLSRIDGLMRLSSSADGTKLFATDGSSIFTIQLYSYSSLAGAPYGSCELTYIGQGQWQVTGSPSTGTGF